MASGGLSCPAEEAVSAECCGSEASQSDANENEFGEQFSDDDDDE